MTGFSTLSFCGKKISKKVFNLVNEHRYDEVLKGVSDKTLEHSFAGDLSLGGKRHDKVSLKKWFERLGTVLPDLKIEITDIQVKENPYKTIAIVITMYKTRRI